VQHNRDVALDQFDPWTHGPLELLLDGQRSLALGTDSGRRLALIQFDNAVEVCIQTFLTLHPRNRGGVVLQRDVVDNAARNFHAKVEFLESYVRDHEIAFGADFNHLIWYHDLRNRLYHSGNGIVPELVNVQGARRAAVAVFQALFGVDPGPALESNGQIEKTERAPGGHARRLTSDGSTTGVATELRGDALALRAHELARVHDPARAGLSVDQIAERLAAGGVRVAGSNPRSVLNSALNRAQHLFSHMDRGRWRWEHEVPIDGISGRELAAAAYDLAQSLDPARIGMHYETLKLKLIDAGLQVGGPNQGQTMLAALGASKDFEAAEPGIWKWRQPDGAQAATTVAAAPGPADLEARFDHAMVQIYARAKREIRYVATRYLQVLSEKGGLGTARQFIRSEGVTDGFTRLWEEGRLDLSVEAHVLMPEFQDLFTPAERAIAAARLAQYGYKGRGGTPTPDPPKSQAAVHGGPTGETNFSESYRGHDILFEPESRSFWVEARPGNGMERFASAFQARRHVNLVLDGQSDTWPRREGRPT
jgi:hypothetical protein